MGDLCSHTQAYAGLAHFGESHGIVGTSPKIGLARFVSTDVGNRETQIPVVFERI